MSKTAKLIMLAVLVTVFGAVLWAQQPVTIVSGGGTALADDADFTDGTTSGTPIGGVAEEASPSTVTEGDFGWAAITLHRALKVSLFDADGNPLTIGTDYTEDTAEAGGESGPLMLTVRRDAAATSAGTDGDFATLNTDGSGRLWVNCGTGCSGGTQYAEDAAHASGNTGTLALVVRNDAGTALAADGDNIPLMVDASGALFVSHSGLTELAGAITAGVVSVSIDDANVTVNVNETGDALTALQLIDNIVGVEDVAETAAGGLAMAGSVRRDTAASSAGTTGDNATVNTDANGLLWTRALDPCSGTAKTHIPINISTATTTELTAALAGASTNYHICSIDIVTAGANNVALVDDDTDDCASVTSGLAGGTTAASGWNFAANGGLTKGNGMGTVFKTNGTNRVLCLVTSAATQLSGSIQVVTGQ